MSTRAVIIGGGIGGLAAARELAAAGCDVTVLEAAPALGGLVEGLDLGGASIERYYHYLLPQETEAQDLIAELGLGDRLQWFEETIGNLVDGRVWKFTGPLDLLRFTPLPFADRIKAGIGALRMSRVRSWPELDAVPAREWLTDLTSPAVTKVVWDPLLRAKFGPAAGQVPAAWMWARLDQRRQAHRGPGGGGKQGKRTGVAYLRGGFGLMFDALAADLRGRGVTIRVSSRAQAIAVEGGRVVGVDVAGERLPADVVVFAGALPQLPALLPEELVDPRWAAARGLGAMCVILETTKAITPVFWTNVCDRDLPFGGIIEHTNLVPTDWYGGHHVAYLSRYFTPDEPIATADVEAEAARWIDGLRRTFPHLRAEDILQVRSFRTPYAAPLVTAPYLPSIPPTPSHVEGLHLATTAQIYPQDRGMHAGIARAKATVANVPRERTQSGREVAAGSGSGGWVCPVCGGRANEAAFPGSTEGSDGGVDPAAFRPSSDEYGQLTAAVLRCLACGHMSVEEAPDAGAVSAAYADAVDEVTLREAEGQVATADAGLELIEAEIRPGRILDVGCWTGSFLVAAERRGWEGVGVEPSAWAASEAKQRGLEVHHAELDDVDLAPASFDAVVSCDVLEHLADPAAALTRLVELLRPGGALYLTVPDAGSRFARTMGKRWWAVVPMHLQYYTRGSMTLLLSTHGLEVRHIGTHPKRFTVRYYAERAAGFVPVLGKLGLRAVERSRRADRLVAPDFGDRMEIVAVKRADAP